MNAFSVFLIALALAVDAFAVAVAAGITIPVLTFRHVFRLAWHFGLFQALMTVIGWAAGLSFRSLIEDFDHWVAFGLLAVVGIRMIIEALKDGDEEERSDPTRGRTLVVLSVATSIDALAVGLSLALLGIEIWMPSLVIGVTALVLTAAGLYVGRLAGTATRLGARVEVGGGLVLVGIGIRILHEHGVFG